MEIENSFKAGYIIPRYSSVVFDEFKWSDHIEEVEEGKEYIEKGYDFGNGERVYYWMNAYYQYDNKEFAIACRKYKYEDVVRIATHCQCNSCSYSTLGFFAKILRGPGCPCCYGCLKEGFEMEYDINEHVMKKTYAHLGITQ